MDKGQFILKNKKRVNFTTGLHMMGEKSGKDDVYILAPKKFKIPSKKVVKKNKVLSPQKTITKKMKVPDLKREAKKRGIKGYSKLKKAQLITILSR